MEKNDKQKNNPPSRKKVESTYAKYDWNALKVEWLKTDLNIAEFARFKGITPSHFYNNIDREDWIGTREKLYQKAISKIQEKKSDELAKRWDDYGKLWKAVKYQAAVILRKTELPNGETKPLKAYELKSLAEAIDIALKAERLMDDKTTGRIGLDVDVVGYIREQMQKKNQ